MGTNTERAGSFNTPLAVTDKTMRHISVRTQETYFRDILLIL